MLFKRLKGLENCFSALLENRTHSLTMSTSLWRRITSLPTLGCLKYVLYERAVHVPRLQIITSTQIAIDGASRCLGMRDV